MPHKLLLADDSVTIQRVIELTFADEDVQVIAVGDGKQAIERIQQDRPDIVLADIGMPERDGYEVASFIKGNPQFAHIPVLLLTGAFEPIDENRARSVGCDGVLVKPFEPQMVINRVRDLLAGRRPAGLWAASQTAQTPVRPPAPAVTGADVRQPAAAGAATPPKQGNDSIDEYFDRLDAAFGANPEAPAGSASTQPDPAAVPLSPPAPQHDYGYRATAPASPAPVNVADWDPHLPGDAAAGSRPESSPAAAPPPHSISSWNPDLSSRANAAAPAPQPTSPAHVPAATAGAAPVPVPPMPPLADAFAALLAAEQGQPIVPPTYRAAAVSDDQVEDIVRRVIDRMGDPSIRRTVLDVAERLVREEIERIKTK
jgi:CheY-like chemotaxis protein